MASIKRRFNSKIMFTSFSIPFFSMQVLDFLLSSTFAITFMKLGLPLQYISIFFFGLRIPIILIQPLLGYFSDRNNFFTRRVGRRFLWILISGLLLPFIYVLATSPQILNNVTLPFFISMTFLFYLLFSVYTNNYSALLISKFRSCKERLIIGALTEFLKILGIVLFTLIVPYVTQDVLFGLILIPSLVFLISILFGIPGLLEEKELIDTYYSPNLQSQEWFFKDFFQRFYSHFHQKNFLLILFRWIAISIFNFFFLGTLSLILFRMDYHFLTLWMIYYIGSIFAIPFSLALSWNRTYLKISVISGFLIGVIILIFPFLKFSILSISILIGALGFTYGVGSVSNIPLLGDVLDESAIINNKRSEGFFYGILSSFNGLIFLTYRTPIIVNTFVSTELGTAILSSFIPGSAIIIITIIFALFYDLKPHKVKTIQDQLKEFQL